VETLSVDPLVGPVGDFDFVFTRGGIIGFEPGRIT
jgi:hypothetical protein